LTGDVANGLSMREELTRLPSIRMPLETLRVQVKLADNAHHATGARDFYGLAVEARLMQVSRQQIIVRLKSTWMLLSRQRFWASVIA
jgi:hypothetical protein